MYEKLRGKTYQVRVVIELLPTLVALVELGGHRVSSFVRRTLRLGRALLLALARSLEVRI